MAKEPTKPPEGSEKPTPPTAAFAGVDPLVTTAKQACDEHEDCTKVTTEPRKSPEGPEWPFPMRNWQCTRKDGATHYVRSFTTGKRLDGLPESAIGVTIRVTGRRRCGLHLGCEQVTTEPIVLGDPICPDVISASPEGPEGPTGPTRPPARGLYSPPYDPSHWITGDGIASRTKPQDYDVIAGSGVPFWAFPPIEERGATRKPYEIITDMETMFRDLYNYMMEASGRMRSWALRFICRALGVSVGVLVLALLSIGCVGVLSGIYLFRALDYAEDAYWRLQPNDKPRRSID